jgi:hypothetical protein
MMEGLLRMNGFSGARLIFRFKDESLNQYNRAIYNLSCGNESNSTNFETGSNNQLESSRTITENNLTANIDSSNDQASDFDIAET